MENKNSPSSILKVGRFSASIRLRKKGGNTLCRDYDQVNLLEERNIKLLLSYERKEKHCDEGVAIRLDRIMAHSLSPRIFNKHQQKVLKEEIEECWERLYGK
jgi:hypothetical protein